MELKKYKLWEIAKVVNGSTPSTACPQYYDGNIVWITPKDLSDQKSKYIEKGERNITEAGYNSCSTQMIPANNLLLTSRAPIGLLAINVVDCCTNQGFKNIVVDKTKVDVDYLYYYLKYHIKEIEALGAGTTFKEVSKNSLENYVLSLPELNIQRKIAKVLSNLDSKIKLNKQINQNLEALARQLYDYWFVQFDFPDENSKPYKSSGGKTIYNTKLKRDIPVGWNVKTVNQICALSRGVSYDKDDLLKDGNGVLVLRGNNIDNNKLIYDANVAFIPESLISHEQQIKKGEIVMTMSSGSKEHVGKCIYFHKDSSHTYGAFLSKFSPLCGYSPFMFLFFCSDYFKSKVKSVCNGTGINNLTNQTFDVIYTIEPNQSVLDMFNEKIAPIFNAIGNNEFDIETLIKQRDELLPLLMNGQVNSDLSSC